MNKDGFTVRMIRRAEIPEMLKFRNAGFGEISRPQWEAMGCTAVLAWKGNKIQGAIPLQFRELMINPRVSVPVVFENAVSVAEKVRSRGLGGAMLDHAERVLRNRIDALCVYRGGESSPGYRFYRKAGHGDLYYICHLSLKHPQGRDNEVDVVSAEEAVGLERQLLGQFKKVYGLHAGYWKREKGYFGTILASHVYTNSDWRLFLLRRKKAILGYAIANPHDPLGPGLGIYDFAASSPAAQQALLEKIEWVARRNKQTPAILGNREHPLFAPLGQRGYVCSEYSSFTMGRIVRADRIFARLASKSPLLHELHLGAVTPHREVMVNRPARPKYRATMYLKESQLTRLLMGRLDMASALEMNMIRLSPLPGRVEKALVRVCAFCPWVTLGMDYI